MALTSIGDLAQSFLNRSANTRLNREISDLATELSTGVLADPRSGVAGDIAGYSALERSISLVSSYQAVAKETALQARGVQASIANIRTQIDQILPNLLQGEASSSAAFDEATSAQAAMSFVGTVSSLNGTLANRQMFSGTATGNVPLRDGEAIMDDIRALVSGATDAATVTAAIDQYFGPTGAFEITDYLGSTDDLAPVQIAPDERVALSVRADDQVFRETLAGMAKVAVLADLSGAMNATEIQSVLSNARSQALGAKDDLISEEANVGAVQARIDLSITRLASEDLSLQQARLGLIGVDPFETATRLEQSQLQLEQMYTLTARMSRLSLVNYL